MNREQKDKKMSRVAHYADYEDFVEITPGVFIDPYHAVYIVDEKGEVVTWNYDEIVEDGNGEGFTAALFAVALAASEGAHTVRENLESKGKRIQERVEKTEQMISDR
jgi:hypothetical protein